MLDNSCSSLRADGMTLLLGFGQQADNSSSHGLRVVMVHEDGMVADQFGNSASAADDYRGSTTHGFGNDHAKGFRVTDLDVDFGALQPTDDVRILHGADEVNALLNPQAGSESMQPLMGVAFVPDDDECLVRKGFENDGDGTKKNFPALDANDVVIEIEDGGDMRPGIVGWAECMGIDAIWNDHRSTSAQTLHVVKHEVRHD